jgi:valyl-tRNA synthetase
MEISSKYSPSEIERKWYAEWLENKLFKSTPDHREPYTIVIPPPNVTGVLHMGHMLNNTIQDVLIRRARMLGKNACWVPGTDHASIATEAKVVAMLKEKGIEKHQLSRTEFLGYAMDWKDKYGGIILEQLKKLGSSCDWDRTRFTMEPKLSAAVINVFIDLYNKGLIYRGSRMVNWDPAGKTALSDEEVIYKEVDSKLFYIKYMVAGGTDYITVATTRPETLLGDTAVCVNPSDKRYAHFKGKKVIVPIVNREVPVIFDDYVDPEFGTGALKVTPAHDINDFNLGERHHLPLIDCFNEDGSMSQAAGFYIGEDRFKVRKLIVKDLEAVGLLEKEEAIRNKVGYSERTDAVIEPRISKQWFVDMKQFMKQNPEVLDAVMGDEIKFYPPNQKNTYRHWIENIKDWCISRQLWWGQQIPAWYDQEGNITVAATMEEAIANYTAKHGKAPESTLVQDEDVLDTWFSSWLWPISVFDGFDQPDNADINYYYPTNDLVTAPEIMFFWVARMIMSGYEYRNEKPFSNVYYTGIVRDKLRRKMSKSLGNSPDPLPMIEEYGADAVRMGMMLCSPAGNDILFDMSQVEQGRNFCNKIWNAYRLVNGWEVSETTSEYYQEFGKVATNWMLWRMDQAISNINDHFNKFRLSDALMAIYKLIWDDFCSWYLEMIKPPFGEAIPATVLKDVNFVFEHLMRLLHPFMPFVTEEIRSGLTHADGYINNAKWPQLNEVTEPSGSEIAFELITLVRNKRNEHGISPKIAANVTIAAQNKAPYTLFKGIIQKLANIESIVFGDANDGLSGLAGNDKVNITYVGWEMPSANPEDVEKEIAYLMGFLKSVDAKLSNEKFMANAKPELIERERQKKADAEQKIAALQQQKA